MGKYKMTYELGTKQAIHYTRCYMLAHLTRNDKHKDCALAYNVLEYGVVAELSTN